MRLDIELTNRCRLECIKCTRTYQNKTVEGMVIRDFPYEQFVRLAESKNYTQMFFGGTYGDCIYYPRFVDIVKVCKANDIAITIHTNGSGKSMEWWESILKMLTPGDRLNFAMDGYKHTVGQYRVNFKEKDFEKNIKVLSRAKNKYKITAIWTFIPMRFNEQQIIDSAKLALKNNIVFMVKKSDRWYQLDDNMLPINTNLIAENSQTKKRK